MADHAETPTPLVPGRDYYIEAGRWVFTREYHLRRGTCCASGCRHCPYRSDQRQANAVESASALNAS